MLSNTNPHQTNLNRNTKTMTRAVGQDNTITCPYREVVLIENRFTSTKHLNNTSFTNFKEGYINFIKSLNEKCNFIVPRYPNTKTILFGMNRAAIHNIEDYLTYWEFYSTIPTLRLKEPGRVRLSTNPEYYDYEFCLLPHSTEFTAPITTTCGSDVEYTPYLHLINEDGRYFVKFEYRAKLSAVDIEVKNDFYNKPLSVILGYHTDDLQYDFEDYSIVNKLWQRTIVKGVVSNYFIINFSDFRQDDEITDLLLRAPEILFSDHRVFAGFSS